MILWVGYLPLKVLLISARAQPEARGMILSAVFVNMPYKIRSLIAQSKKKA